MFWDQAFFEGIYSQTHTHTTPCEIKYKTPRAILLYVLYCVGSVALHNAFHHNLANRMLLLTSEFILLLPWWVRSLIKIRESDTTSTVLASCVMAFVLSKSSSNGGLLHLPPCPVEVVADVSDCCFSFSVQLFAINLLPLLFLIDLFNVGAKVVYFPFRTLHCLTDFL